MNRENIKKRFVKVNGVPLVTLTPYRKEQRHEVSKIPVSSEDEQIYDDFFDFEKDLNETESARKQFEKMEEERLFREKNYNQDIQNNQESFVVFEEIVEEKEPEYIDPYKKICKSLKNNGSPCKGFAMSGSDYCKSHIPK